MRLVVGWFALSLAAACAPLRAPPTPVVAPVASSPIDRKAVQVAPRDTAAAPREPASELAATEETDEERWRERSRACAPGQALVDAQNRSLDYLGQSPFSVVRVSPLDTLHLRRESSPSAQSLAQLDFQQAAMRWTGSACNVGGALWLEVEVNGLRGWVNGFYARPATPPRDETERVKSWLTGTRAKSAPELAERLRAALTRNEGVPNAQPACAASLIGSAPGVAQARFVLYIECGMNDSVAGSQLLVTATSDAAGWSVSSVEWRDVCLRGADEYCI